MCPNLKIEDSPYNELQTSLIPDYQTSLVRHGTLLSMTGTPGRNAAQLKSILGNSNARLKPGASLPPATGRRADAEGTPLEQARSRARVELDLVLESKVCVQGGYLRGHVRLVVPNCIKNEIPVMISGAKIRVIGFETISNQRDRYPFYQCSSPLSTATVTSGSLHDALDDAEGFAWAIEGEHEIPFSIHLPLCVDYGVPKGAIQIHSGIAVRYIAMVSIKIKDSVSDSRSVAHFYRDCEIWPRLDPSIILAPTDGPLEATALKGLFLGGSGKVELTASVHRLHWVAGQQCFVDISVINSSKKAITTLTLSLMRTTVVFKPNYPLDTLQDGSDIDLDACQTSTSRKEVAESVLEVRQRGTRGHASAKGWWVGVPPGETVEFSHSILLPPDSLTVSRGRLLEVEFSIQVALSAGPLRTADVQASLPIQIVNLLSIDPPPSFFVRKADYEQYTEHTKRLISTLLLRPHGTRPLRADAQTLSSCNSYSRAGSLLERSEATDSSIEHSSTESIYDTGSLRLENDDVNHQDYMQNRILRFNTSQETYSGSGQNFNGLAMYEDDNEENTSYLLHVDPDFENAPRFADLYHISSHDGVLHPQAVVSPDSLNPVAAPFLDTTGFGWTDSHHSRHSSFARRVQEKLEAAVTASNPHTSMQISSSNDSSVGIDSRTCRSGSESTPPTEETVFPSPSLMGYSASDNAAAAFQIEQGQSLGLYDISEHGEITLSNTEDAQPVTSSLAPMTSVKNAEPCYGGSRQLPSPPSIMATPFHTMSSTHIGRSTPLTSPTVVQHEHGARFGSDNQRHQDSVHDSQHLHQSSQFSGVDDRDSGYGGATSVLDADPVSVLSTRPTISALRDHAIGGMGGSSTSVRERIKELEERQRLLELNEA